MRCLSTLTFPLIFYIARSKLYKVYLIGMFLFLLHKKLKLKANLANIMGHFH